MLTLTVTLQSRLLLLLKLLVRVSNQFLPRVTRPSVTLGRLLLLRPILRFIQTLVRVFIRLVSHVLAVVLPFTSPTRTIGF